MKRFIDNFPSGGVGFQNEDWNTAQKEPLKAAESIIAGLQEPCIVSGGEINSVDGANIDINSGYVFLNNAIMPFDAYTGAHGYLIEDSNPSTDPRFPQDGGVQFNFTTSRKAIYSPTQPVSGDYIVLNNFPYQYINQVRFRQATPKGTVVMLATGSSDLFGVGISNADTNGLGRGWYFGFGLCNGLNGTTLDLSDKFIKSEQTFGNAGASGGLKTIDTRHRHKTVLSKGDSSRLTGFDGGGVETDIYVEETNLLDAGTARSRTKIAINDFQYYTDELGNAAQDNQPQFLTLYYMERI
jgi:hypothetical protein